MASSPRSFVLAVLMVASLVPCRANPSTVTVEGRAYEYGPGGFVSGATVRVLGDVISRRTTFTDSEGFFTMNATVGEELTLVLSKDGYTTVQSATVTVPPEGLRGKYAQMTFQVPTDTIFELFQLATGSHLNTSLCHLVVTVCALNKTIDDAPQGEPGVEVFLDPPGPKAFFFGVFRNLTNPFARGLNTTSADGGVLFANVAPLPAGQAYTVRAAKPGVTLSTTRLICTPGNRYLVNASPPHGPNVIAEHGKPSAS